MPRFKQRTILETLLVIACISAIIYFMPRDTKFNYHFSINTPWTYGQLMSDFDFPIYKSDESIQAEQDSLYREFQPYFNIDSTISTNAIAQFQKDYDDRFYEIITPQQYNSYRQRLKNAYAKGIISIDNSEIIKSDSLTDIKIVTDDNIARTVNTKKLNTIKSVYRQLTYNDTLPKDVLMSLKLEEYIQPNIIYNKAKTELALEELKASVSISDGMVQKGQKIISRGDIVDEKLYKTLQSYQYEWNKRDNEKRQTGFTLLGQILLVTMALLGLIYFLRIYRPAYFAQSNKFILIYLLITLFTLTVAWMVRTHTGNVFMVPFAMAPILLCLFADSRTAFMTHVVQIFICSTMLQAPHIFMLIEIAGGFAAIVSLRELSARSQLFRTVFFVLLSQAMVCFAYELISENDITKLNLSMYIYFLINGALLLSTYPLMFAIEKIFGFTSAVTFIELSNINNELLYKLSQDAPGTFQHSMQVGNLAAEAARRVGANSIEVRTGALYHDIGKMKNPIYFTENQSGGINPHNNLPPEESAAIILRHVTDGVSIANSHHLPDSIKDFITTHHGTSKTGYFYITYKNAHPDEYIDESLFTYAGPKPQTREQAILMMADSVEAASHSLKEYTESNIHTLVDKIIDAQLENGQFSLTPLTFKDIDTIKSTFKERLKAIYHTRISYPEEKKESIKNETEAETTEDNNTEA
ncbi:MAG: HDIG domain-containing protein [Bacteroidaceae bacterium]|nr:HDIG domain-containing protein [Bacteroidaceae bacterium]